MSSLGVNPPQDLHFGASQPFATRTSLIPCRYLLPALQSVNPNHSCFSFPFKWYPGFLISVLIGIIPSLVFPSHRVVPSGSFIARLNWTLV